MDFLEEREDNRDEEVKRRGSKVLLPKKTKDCHNEYIITCMYLGKSIYVCGMGVLLYRKFYKLKTKYNEISFCCWGFLTSTWERRKFSYRYIASFFFAKWRYA